MMRASYLLLFIVVILEESCAAIGEHRTLVSPTAGIIRISADDTGFHPNHLAVPRGEEVTLIVTRRTKRFCLHAMVVYVDGTRFVRELPYDRATQFSITPRLGRDAGFTCSTGMYTGTIQIEEPQ